MTNDFLLYDRIDKIQQINRVYNLVDNCYVSFSGGKDSTVLSWLIDEALPGNDIPRVFFDTGIEYKMIRDFVKSCQVIDKRVQIIKPMKNIKSLLSDIGYPFKSKQHSHNLQIYQSIGDRSVTVFKYLNEKKGGFACPDNLRIQFTPDYKLKVSENCCLELKKHIAKEIEKTKPIALTGMRKQEGGSRNNLSCIITKGDKLRKFHPLSVVDNDFIEWCITENDIEICDIYKPPYNFKRTGCKGCPFSPDLKKQLETLSILLPSEYKQCVAIWKPVYDEYIRLGYRLKEYPKNLFSL